MWTVRHSPQMICMTEEPTVSTTIYAFQGLLERSAHVPRPGWRGSWPLPAAGRIWCPPWADSWWTHRCRRNPAWRGCVEGSGWKKEARLFRGVKKMWVKTLILADVWWLWRFSYLTRHAQDKTRQDENKDRLAVLMNKVAWMYCKILWSPNHGISKSVSLDCVPAQLCAW